MDCGFLWIQSSSLQGIVMHTCTPGRRQRADDTLRAEWVTQKPCALGRHFLTLWPNTWGNKTFLSSGFIVAEEWHLTGARKWRWLHILCPAPFIPSEPKSYLESPHSHRGTQGCASQPHKLLLNPNKLAFRASHHTFVSPDKEKLIRSAVKYFTRMC